MSSDTLGQINPNTGMARRIAAELVSEYQHDSYDAVVQLVAYAYARGNREGYEEAMRDSQAALAMLREAVQS